MTLKNYIVGFALSLILTGVAFSLVEWHLVSSGALGLLLVLLALTQLVVQTIFFLHLGHDDPGKNKLMTYLFALLIVAIVVIGSLWIMGHLKHNMGEYPFTGAIDAQSEE